MNSIIITTVILILFNVEKPKSIYVFKDYNNIDSWSIVDDRVMGGVSQGRLILNDSGNGVYTGKVSTDNNGGFSSIRFQFSSKNVSEYNAILLKVKGDNKNYQFRIKTAASQYYSFVYTFSTNGDWQEIRIPFDSFKPQFRGRELDKANFLGESMEEIAFLIGNKKNESFKLEIQSISIIE